MTLIAKYQKRKDALDEQIKKARAKKSEAAIKKATRRQNLQILDTNARALRRLKNELELFLKMANQTHERVDKALRKIEKEYRS